MIFNRLGMDNHKRILVDTSRHEQHKEQYRVLTPSCIIYQIVIYQQAGMFPELYICGHKLNKE